ncbi:hypothetical protein DU500_17855 (plasmid) [Haloplanus rubicundus]|uniref:Uncharacterized protein n=1 Tax=Haloplanus rubicundus TaxID=1547898 RepID=A0A345E816_9EURY|nr:hypothetical protein DU500_17855 [Haloplanus rubicundus]
MPALIAEEYTLRFAGLADGDAEAVPGNDERSPDAWCGDDGVNSLEQVIAVLPRASSGELWATNEFVETDGDVDITAIESVHGLDTDVLERTAGRSLDELAARTDVQPIVPVDDHQDIVDRRRKALWALGYDVRFRWQIASDRYSIINPQEAYQPIITALRRRGETGAFGWLSYRDWGGLLKLFVVCPGLKQVVGLPEEPVDIDDEDDIDALGAGHVGDTGAADPDEDLVVYGGFETGYDFRGTQTLWAKPILYFPDSETIVPDTGQRYTRRHYGQATNADHERANDRVPISEWWASIYDDVETRLVDVDETLRRARAITYDFEVLPFSAADCYRYWGIADTYATVAADRATSLADPTSRPTVFNLQLSLLIALLEEYTGSWASNTYQEYIETAGELLQKPAMMIQLAMQEHDRLVEDRRDRVLPDGQQTLSDALEDIVHLSGIEVDTEAALSDGEAQRLHDEVQRHLDDI